MGIKRRPAAGLFINLNLFIQDRWLACNVGAQAFAFKIFISNSNSLYVIQTDFCAGSAKTIQIIHSLRHFLNLQF
jgi:hypothetical protein